MNVKDFCVECEISFVLVDRHSRATNTCTECAQKLRLSCFGECDNCRRVIEVGEKIHLKWAKLCGTCARKLSGYRCETVARE